MTQETTQKRKHERIYTHLIKRDESPLDQFLSDCLATVLARERGNISRRRNVELQKRTVKSKAEHTRLFKPKPKRVKTKKEKK